jgi:hypothetical protein
MPKKDASERRRNQFNSSRLHKDSLESEQRSFQTSSFCFHPHPGQTRLPDAEEDHWAHWSSDGSPHLADSFTAGFLRLTEGSWFKSWDLWITKTLTQPGDWGPCQCPPSNWCESYNLEACEGCGKQLGLLGAMEGCMRFLNSQKNNKGKGG